MRKFNKLLKAGIWTLIGAIILAALISLISIIGFGKIYFFDGYEITAIGWTVVILGILAGCVIILIGGTMQLKGYGSDLSESSLSVLENARKIATENGATYFIEGVRGRILTVYEDKVIITTRLTAGSFLTGNATDGEKTIYFVDCIGIQFKKSDLTLGYLQFETASTMMNNGSSNMFSENSFTWDLSVVSNEKMEEVTAFVRSKIDDCKRTKASPAFSAPQSSADELKKYKELLDAGIISQEEFDLKKKQLLGL